MDIGFGPSVRGCPGKPREMNVYSEYRRLFPSSLHMPYARPTQALCNTSASTTQRDGKSGKTPRAELSQRLQEPVFLFPTQAHSGTLRVPVRHSDSLTKKICLCLRGGLGGSAKHPHSPLPGPDRYVFLCVCIDFLTKKICFLTKKVCF